MPDHQDLLSVKDARARILAAITPLAPVTLDLEEAFGLVAADDVTSPIDVPGFDNSAFDGYALRAADVGTAQVDAAVALKVVGKVPAGSLDTVTVGPGTAARIMTGAPIPEGANAVLPFEATDGVHWTQKMSESVGQVRVLESANL
jgi:molybdopterin molybdotransferase